jgi:hypothetical protein
MAYHQTVTLDHGGTPVEIDWGIAPLIETLWAREIETVSSCQDFSEGYECVRGAAMVGFASKDDARRFARTCRQGRASDPSVRSFQPTPADAVGAEGTPEQLAREKELSLRGELSAVVFPAERIPSITAELGGDPEHAAMMLRMGQRLHLLPVLEATLKEESKAKAVVLDDDGEHVIVVRRRLGRRSVGKRYYVPSETWAGLEATVAAYRRGEDPPPGPLTLESSKRGPEQAEGG